MMIAPLTPLSLRSIPNQFTTNPFLLPPLSILLCRVSNVRRMQPLGKKIVKIHGSQTPSVWDGQSSPHAITERKKAFLFLFSIPRSAFVPISFHASLRRGNLNKVDLGSLLASWLAYLPVPCLHAQHEIFSSAGQLQNRCSFFWPYPIKRCASNWSRGVVLPLFSSMIHLRR